MITLFDHLLLWGALFATGFALGFLIGFGTVPAGRGKRL